MRRTLRFTLATGMILLVCSLSGGLAAEEKDELTDNPLYKGWSSFAPGSKAVHKEKTVHGDGSIDEKEIEYKLLKVTDKRAIVNTVVVERDLLSEIETAPTRTIYPAKIKEADLKAALVEHGAKLGKETIKVLGKDVECMTFEVTRKNKTEEIKTKGWRAASIPGGLVKRIRTTTEDGKLVATTTTTLISYRVGPHEKGKDKE